MSGTIISLLVSIVGGALGGNGIGAALKNLSLGSVGNTIVGGIGGGLFSQVLPMALPMISGAAGSTDVGAMATQLVGGGVAGGVLTTIVGAAKNAMGPKKSS